MTDTVQDGLRKLTAFLKADGVAGAAREARLLLAHVMQKDPARMTLLGPEPLEEWCLVEAYMLAEDRKFGTPLSRIVGQRLFYGREFVLSPAVLDPRPETECLVEAALAEPFAQVLDLGTGSGCIAVTLLAERPSATGVATDLSDQALEIAQANARSSGVLDRLWLTQSDWWSGIAGQFDLIVSNPPYIALDEMDGLMPEVRDHDPRLALTDEGDGLGAYRDIARGLGAHLAPGGRVVLEIGPTQAAAVSELLNTAGLVEIRVLPDLDGRDRVVCARNRAQMA